MRNLCVTGFMGTLILFALAGDNSLPAQGKDETVENPIYKHWAAFKVGTSVVRREKVKFPADTEEHRMYPEGSLVKDTTYKLIDMTDKKAVVEVTVQEHHHGYVQESPPLKMIYFAHIKKGQGTPKEGFSKHKEEDVEVKIKGKAYKATLVETQYKVGGITRSQKIWLSDDIPGGIIKDERSQKKGKEIISESTLEVLKVNLP
jgi:hypothetical protein